MPHPLEKVIASADAAIVSEDFDTLLEFYSDNAVLVIKPGMSVTGRAAIRKAFERIAEYFNHSVQVQQAGMAPNSRRSAFSLLQQSSRSSSSPRELDDLGQSRSMSGRTRILNI